jgi:hypothetical protein
MSQCNNCGVELTQGETEICFVCEKASPKEKERRRSVALQWSVPLPEKKPHVNILNSTPLTDKSSLQLGLSSGIQIEVTKLVLYPQDEIAEYMKLQTRAREELAQFSTGIGFWGSPEWAIGGAAALGIVESVISNAKQKKGMEILGQANKQREKIRTLGTLFELHQIAGIWQPDPTAWEAQIRYEQEQKTLSYIFNGDEYLWAKTEDGLVAIRWTAINSYRLI